LRCRARQAVQRQRNRAFLEGIAEHEGIGRDAVAHQDGRHPGGVDDVEIVVADRLAQRRLHRVHLEIDIGIHHEACGRLQIGVDKGACDAALGTAQRRGPCGDHDVAAEDEIGAAGRDADARDVFRARCDPDMAHHRAVLLRQPGEVQRRAASAIDMRGHAEQGADRNDAGAADAGDEDVVGRVELAGRGQRQIGKQLAGID
jgi:hypothetical protein